MKQFILYIWEWQKIPGSSTLLCGISEVLDCSHNSKMDKISQDKSHSQWSA